MLELQKDIDYVEAVIEKYMPVAKGQQKVIMEAMNYSILAGGKRLRPVFMLESYKMFGGWDLKVIEPFLAAIEMIHTYSLIHDDLPAMDDDDFRRGQQTAHVVYGEAMAILAGDALLNYAFETALKCEDYISEQLDAGVIDTKEAFKRNRQMMKAMKVLACKPGIYGMIGGQVVDVLNENKEVTKDQLDFINKLKTGALIEASFMIGAILAGADENQVNIIEEAALKIGLAFQVQDDILDVTSTTEVIGKPVNSDEKNHKTTYVGLVGLDKAKEEVEKLSEEGISMFTGLGLKNDFLFELLYKLIYREK